MKTQMKATAAASSIVMAMLSAGLAHAAPDQAPGRYSMSPAEGGGMIRLDRETGEMSICSGKDGEWACKPMPETDAAMKKKIEQLEGQVGALKGGSEPQQPGRPLGPPQPGDTIPPNGGGSEEQEFAPNSIPLPTEKDVDRLFDYVEGMVKKFKERTDRLKKETEKEPGTNL